MMMTMMMMTMMMMMMTILVNWYQNSLHFVIKQLSVNRFKHNLQEIP